MFAESQTPPSEVDQSRNPVGIASGAAYPPRPRVDYLRRFVPKATHADTTGFNTSIASPNLEALMLYLPRRASLAFLCLPTVLVPIGACVDEPTAMRPTDSQPVPEMATTGLGSWAARAPLPTAMDPGASSGVIRNSSGQDIMYVVGGVKNTAAFWPECLLLVYAYNATKNTWTRRADLLSKRCGPATAAVGGKLYSVGGQNTNRTQTKTLYVYTPGSNTWSRKADMPFAHFGARAMAIGSDLYVVALDLDPDVAILRLYRYTPATNTWTRRPDVPLGRRAGAFAAGVINGKIYLIRGQTPAVLMYDPKTNQWTAKPPIPESDWKPYEPESNSLGTASAVVLNQKLYLIGGARSVSEGTAYMKTTFAYDPLTNRLTRKADMGLGRAGAAVGKVKNASGVIQVIATGGIYQDVEPRDTRVTQAYTP